MLWGFSRWLDLASTICMGAIALWFEGWGLGNAQGLDLQEALVGSKAALLITMASCLLVGDRI